ncbi:Hypothetical protein A7982_06042 [Minicystis rosea]|nr:Hypothetical protein A7982_06042 [Minicystis rosea]
MMRRSGSSHGERQPLAAIETRLRREVKRRRHARPREGGVDLLRDTARWSTRV